MKTIRLFALVLVSATFGAMATPAVIETSVKPNQPIEALNLFNSELTQAPAKMCPNYPRCD